MKPFHNNARTNSPPGPLPQTGRRDFDRHAVSEPLHADRRPFRLAGPLFFRHGVVGCAPAFAARFAVHIRWIAHGGMIRPSEHGGEARSAATGV